ncbi:putative receptor-like protein kinase [Quercus suber]|uniref:Receptor-like protein kinase n=1 Tax=Quercus suber TaxID=58331 RepID=A0AAW0M297_QUESU
MRGNKCRASWPQPYFSFSIIFLSFFFLFNLTKFASAKSNASSTFTPSDNYLIDCGSTQETRLKDGRTFKSDHDATSLLQTEEDVQASVDSISINVSSSISPSPLFRTARIFLQDSTYTFFVAEPGWHWVRLYLYPIDHPSYNLTEAVFSVFSGKIVLLHQIQIQDKTSLVFKEYLISVSGRLSLQFKPKKGSFAFINAIEVVSAPDSLITNIATSVSPLGDFNGLSNSAFQVCYRLNVGGPTITSENDTLSRTWEPDGKYNKFLQGSKNASVSAKIIKYPESGATPYIAPSSIYASAVHIEDPLTMQPNVNLTWKLNVDPGYSYLIRLHFCDIVSKVLNSLYFNVYINTMVGVSALDLSSLTNALDTAYYKDFVLNGDAITNDSILVQIGPYQSQSASLDAILNGLEIMKMNNEANSFDGLFTVDGSYKGPNSTTKKLKIIAAVGLGLAVATMLLLAMVFVRWQKRPEGWEKRNSFSSWLLPLHGSNSSFLSSKSSSRRSSQYGSRKSKNGTLQKIIDPYIASSIDPGSLKKYVEGAEKCLAEHGVDRPGMGDVLWHLEYALQLQEASSQIAPPEDSSAVILASEKPSSNSSGPSEEQVVVVVYENLELSPGSPLFSQINNFQGRVPRD